MKTNKKLHELRRYVDVSKYDINQRIQMILDEVEQQIKDYERQARAETNPISINQNH